VGLEIIERLRGQTTGYAVPTFVVDAPGGGGKIPLMPNSVVEVKEGTWTLRNYAGKIYTYREEPTGDAEPWTFTAEPSYALTD
jgi:lysine 2,3-aminomutase